MTGPKEGIYLDATLAVIGEQLDERIDELSRRRRTRRRFGVAALSVFALASGSIAAVALSATGEGEEPPAVVMSTEHVVQCVEGEFAARDAYFTVRYRTTAGAGVDQPRLCAQAWADLASDSSALLAATPEGLITIVEGYLSEAIDLEEADVAVEVSEASFGRLAAASTPPAMVACERGATTLVLSPVILPTTPSERALLCARAGA